MPGTVMMERGDIAYVVDTEKAFEEAVLSVLRSVERSGWALFGVYDIRERLAAKGFDQPPLKVIEICSAGHADRLLRGERLVSLCLPCRIAVIGGGDRVRIAGMRPGALAGLFRGVPASGAAEAEKEVRAIIDGAR
jgi:uncharacterized protein (DUF302 family)